MRRATAIVVAVTLVAVGVGTASAMTPIDVVRQVMEAAPGRMPQSVRCVPTTALPRATGRDYSLRASGVTTTRGKVVTVRLDWTKVCNPLYRFRTHRRIQPAEALEAMLTVLHEKVHVQGVHAEWKANCIAIPQVLRQLKVWGYSARQIAAVRWYLALHLDKGRPSEYRVRGKCYA